MAKFGFQVYRVRPKRYHPGRYVGWKDVPGGYVEHLLRTSDILIKEQGGEPDEDHPLESEPFASGATFTDIGLVEEGSRLVASDASNGQVARWFKAEKRANGRHLSFRFLAGTRGEFDTAIGGGVDTSLTGRAASRPFRAELLVPATETGTALIAVEAVNHFCPRMPLEKLLGLGSKRASQQDATAENDSPFWYYPVLQQVIDPQFLAELLSDPQRSSVVMKHRGHDGSGDPSKAKFRAQWSDLTVTQLTALGEWVKLPVSERKLKSLRGLLDIVSPDDDSAFDDVVFDEGYVSLSSGEAGTRLYPDSEVNRFTYPIPGSSRPSPEFWEARVKERLLKLGPSLQW